MSRYARAHINPQGPGDTRPTALQIVKDEGLLDKLTDKVVLITGGNQGIGLETARALHATGATVYITARYRAGHQRHCLMAGSKVRAAAQDFLAKVDKLNILILNAGVMATPEGKTEDGFETQFGTNHLGHFLLFQLLKPALLAATTPSFQSRVISLASKGHRAGGIHWDDYNFEKDTCNPWLAYAQSKTANIYFASELDRRYADQGIHGLSVHPGYILTNLGKYIDLSTIDLDGPIKNALRNKAQGAATTVYATVSKDWEGRGGKYLADFVEERLVRPGVEPTSPELGHAVWIYDEEAERKLWELSERLVGLHTSQE
ncbi:related to reductases [Fusarium fujikuroi IMI 58289]|uniref:Related to reductases n=1 Tax=Gibberella fujikuroi (strain CBS 195.34 / IMI 58289 / NRRL A-6831) TaxID=1279085 RepID=S0EN56_GIBF5|nr:related to reductases [Fusarium fujikuroi IMI 58289]KLP23390.1 reductase [Fusarium fujikuroi]CCT75389.1 related to reductases [Fusarium fujikuroi IMI 58289]SCO25872.1 related to reductases [Fusarium fujikuroi]